MTQKSRILHILRYLETQTDEAHPATVADVVASLESASIEAGRKAVTKDIELLMDAGFDVVVNAGKPIQYFMGDRHFEMPELKLLVDAVQAAKFISAKKSASLTKKLTALTSVHLAGELQRQTYIESRVKADNEQIYIAVDMLHAAIHSKRKVLFKYYEYNQRKEKIYKHGRQVYSISPYGWPWTHDCYYVVGYSDSHAKVITFRIDRIATPELSDTLAEPPAADFDISVYARSVFSMYDGPMQTVTLQCENAIMKSILDRFGEEVETNLLDREHFKATVSVSTSPTFYGWVFSFGGKMSLLGPEHIVNEYADMLRSQLPE